MTSKRKKMKLKCGNMVFSEMSSVKLDRCSKRKVHKKKYCAVFVCYRKEVVSGDEGIG
jgi:hypothetical protein